MNTPAPSAVRQHIARRVVFVAAIAGAFAVSGCSSARRTPPVAPPLQLADPALERGRVVFYRHCHLCHPHGGAGLGPAIVNKPLPGFLMAFQVRHGLGAMPSFKPEKIPAEDLDALVAYIKAVMANKPTEDNVTPRAQR